MKIQEVIFWFLTPCATWVHKDVSIGAQCSNHYFYYILPYLHGM